MPHFTRPVGFRHELVGEKDRRYRNWNDPQLRRLPFRRPNPRCRLWSAPPDQAARIGTEGWLNKVHSALIETGNLLFMETGDAALARETFEAAEENRASSLRALVGQANPGQLPASFWEALAGLQSAEVQALRVRGVEAADALETAHAQLVSLEASLGPAYRPLPGRLLDRTRRALGPDTAWL